MAKQAIKILIAGRGLGKTTVLALECLNRVLYLPKSRGIFVGLTYAQIQTKTIPPIIRMWAEMGYYPGIHYVIGKRPPDGFKSPYQSPINFKNIISWWNGSIIELGSFDRKDHLRGGSNDWIIVDEAGLIDKKRYNTEVLPTLRGSDFRLNGKEGHLSQIFVSSMPWLSKGKWLLDYEAESKAFPDKIYYLEGTSWHNRFILTDAVILNWQKEMGPLFFGVECMNSRKTNVGNKFYPRLKEDLHYYSDSFNYEYLDTIQYEADFKPDSRQDADCNPDLPLDVTFDFGSFNCLIVGQEHWPEYRELNEFHTKNDEILEDIIDAFCDYYRHHKSRRVYVYGDKSGNSRQANSRLTLLEAIRSRLRDNGWTPIQGAVRQISHYDRHLFFNRVFSEDEVLLPRVRINQNHCKSLIISLENAGMKDDKKDKSSERSNIPQQHATHYSDAFDYKLYVKYYKRNAISELPPQPVEVR